MRLVEFAMGRKSLTVLVMLILLFGGTYCYLDMGRLEYPAFTIKTAVISTQYPGATAREVEEEVTDRIEEEIQKMDQIDNLQSISRPGLSIIYVNIKEHYTKAQMQQIWDVLRRKVADVRASLPSNCGTPVVKDDFGDIYGIFLAVSGDGYTVDELKDYTDNVLKKEILRVPDVAKVDLWGVPRKVIFVEFERSQLATLGVSQEQIFQILSSQNQVASAGKVKDGPEYLTLRVTGNISSEDAIRNLLVPSKNGTLVRIGDFAKVTRSHEDPLRQILRFDGKRAIGIGVSTAEGGNVVRMGNRIEQLLASGENRRPAGMRIDVINYQSRLVLESLDNFMVNLLESIVIVIALLLIFMGIRTGLVIGATLVFIIFGTFIGMRLMDLDLQQVSLGALIIALGMLVDNAIVIADSFLVKISRGTEREQAARDAVTETQWPLLGATAVAVLAFLAVGFNPGNVGEYCRSLFWVIFISLSLSWLLAVTVTPLLCLWFVPNRKSASGKDVYDAPFYRSYRAFLHFALTHRIAVFLLLALGLGAALYGFTLLPRSFFPDSTRRQFYIDYWRTPQNSHIEETAADAAQIEKHLKTLPGVESTTSFIGEGGLRFLLSYDYVEPNSNYAQILVNVKQLSDIERLVPEIETYLRNTFPAAEPRVRKFIEGPRITFPVEARFRGPDHKVLRKLAERAKELLRGMPELKNLRDDWRPDVKTVKVNFSEVKSRQTGITRSDVSNALLWNFSGVTAGVFREGNELIPIVSRPVAGDRLSIDNLENVRVWSSSLNKSLPVTQAVDSIGIAWEPPVLRRRDRMPAILIQCDPVGVTADTLQKRVAAKLAAMELPPGYTLEWNGEYDQSMKAQSGLRHLVPLSLVLMFLCACALFKTLREPLVIYICLPFALVGVVFGLMLFGLSFGFMAILGFIGLSGMLVKNAIVLLDQINLDIAAGKKPYTAVLDSSVSRLRPVSMAAGTTVLGVAPLITHQFFAGMAAAIMCGLLAATVLTLLIVPALYITFFGIRPEE